VFKRIADELFCLRSRFGADQSDRPRLLRLLGQHRLAQFELQPPAMLADLRLGPDFERADFGEMRAQPHRHQPLLGLLAESDHRLQRRMLVQRRAGRGRGKFDDVARGIVGALERAVQPEGDRFVRDELQTFEIQRQRRAFFGAARNQAHGPQRGRFG
jgi:hypothetical protein